MRVVLLIDFGSTHTKTLAIDLDEERIVGRAQAVTTVDQDITIGLNNALETLFHAGSFNESDIIEKLASSSAAGGLRLATIGLVPALTLEAARRAALGAGAKVVWSSGYELDEDKVSELESASPDIILLSGGSDGGDKNVIVHNATMIAASRVTAPVVVAGNRVVASSVKQILEKNGKYVVVTNNVLPELDRLKVEPAQAVIREIFMKRITNAKGLNRAQEYIGDIVMPTPKATLQAAQLLADGAEDVPGWGSVMIVEVGGATINIHSVADGEPADPQTVMKGLPEARTKRTVEGDLGIRYNAPTILDFVGSDAFLRKLEALCPGHGLDADGLTAAIQYLSANVGFKPVSDLDHCIDRALAESAISFAVERHAGILKSEYLLTGEVKIQRGKDLTRVAHLIGTGGIFKYGRTPQTLIESALFDAGNPWSLKPRSPTTYIDNEYILYGIGLLAEKYPGAAMRIARKYICLTKLDVTD
jgi:uncharacterized protein (TIGR01319 family)